LLTLIEIIAWVPQIPGFTTVRRYVYVVVLQCLSGSESVA